MDHFNLALQLSWQVTAGASVLAGALSHHLIFRRLEIDSAGWQIVFTYVSSLALIFICYAYVTGYGILAALLRTLVVANAYSIGLATSILVYRAFFHRLRRFPGPFQARLSRFYAFRKVMKTVKGCEDVRKMHEKYGDFVRIGPREISINRPSAIHTIYEMPTKTSKSAWYNQVSSDITKVSLNQTRDPRVHKQRKKGWERGLGSRALATYEPRVAAKLELLLSRVATYAGKPINMTEYSMFFSFDVMGEVGLSKDFRMLEQETEHPAIQGVHQSMMAIGVLGTVPWLLAMIGKIPGASGGYSTFTSWCYKQLQQKRRTMIDERVALKSQEPQDIMSWLLKAKEDGDPCAPPGDRAVEEDARLLIIAGSDTVTTAITNALFYLAKSPQCYKALQEALQRQFPGGDNDWTYEKARNVPYLDYVIYETLRLRPSVPGGLARVTPPQGLSVDGIFIPGNTVTSVPTYAMQLDQRYWEDALSFKPERWEGLSTEKVPWIPFSRGQWTCPGKALAMMEMRMVLGRIALQYDISFPENMMTDSVDLDFKDTFTQTLPPVYFIFTPKLA